MEVFIREVSPHKKKAKKKSLKKSDHKHEYELVEKEALTIKTWFNYTEVCKICGKINNELRIEK